MLPPSDFTQYSVTSAYGSDGGYHTAVDTSADTDPVYVKSHSDANSRRGSELVE